MYWWQGETYHRDHLVEHLQNRLIENMEKWERSILRFALDWLDEQKNNFQVKTSGSTGSPKIINLSRKQMKKSAQATASYLGLSKGKSALLVLPADFIAGKMMIVRALETGLDFYYYPPRVSVIDDLDRDFDFAAFIPLQIQYAIDSGQMGKLNRIKNSIVGGAALTPKYEKKIKQLKTRFFATYGMTETITHVAMKDLKSDESYFSALPGIRFSVDKNHCLQINSTRFTPATIQTNDVVELISEKAFKLKGRFDNIINSGALKIIPEELEERIQTILEQEVMIAYQKDEKLGQKVVMLMEENKLNESEIFEKLSGQIEKNQLPKKIFSVSQFIRTENKKINRKKMQDWVLEMSD